jgi:uncharacterized damage-inducible protein DinB
MPGLVRPVTDERDALLAYLEQQRSALRTAAYGLTDDEARAVPTTGALSVGGLLKHVTQVERNWLAVVRGEHQMDESAYEDGFRLREDETLAGVLADYAQAAAETVAVVTAEPDLGRPVPVPPGVPWFPQDVAAWSVRWVLLHLIEETARHAGHADIVRESVDGATAFALLAAVEAWPASPWITPWQPKVPQQDVDESGLAATSS